MADCSLVNDLQDCAVATDTAKTWFLESLVDGATVRLWLFHWNFYDTLSFTNMLPRFQGVDAGITVDDRVHIIVGDCYVHLSSIRTWRKRGDKQ